MQLGYKGVWGYSPVPSIRKRAFLDKFERTTIREAPFAFTLYMGYRFSLASLYILSILSGVSIFLFVITLIVGTLFASVVDREIYDLAVKKAVYSGENKTLYNLSTEQADGWYQDPWGFGEVNQERLWQAGEWTEQTRMKVLNIAKSDTP